MTPLIVMHMFFLLFNSTLIYLTNINFPLLIANGFIALLSLFISIYNLKAKKMLVPFGLPILIFLTNYYLNNQEFGQIGLLIVFSSLCFFLTFIYSIKLMSVKVSSESDIQVSFGLVPFFFTMYLVYICLLNAVPVEIESAYFNLAGFILLTINFMYLLVLNSNQRSYGLKLSHIFSPSILAVLILLISGSFLISNTANTYVLKTWNVSETKSSNHSNAKKKKYNFDSQEIGYSADMKLSNSTNLQKKHIPEVYLKFDDENSSNRFSSGNIYLKGASFDTFVGDHWENYYDQYKKAEDGVDNLADGVIRILEDPENIKPVEYTVYQLNGWHGNILGLPNILSIKIDKMLIADNETYYLSQITGNRISYQAKSAYVTYDELSSKDLVVNSKHQIYLKTFGDVSNKIAEIGHNLTKDLTSLNEKIEMIRYYFRQNFRYSLVTLNKDNKDPLENFFFYEKKGHCELYSTAMVMLLRGAGIPARQCVGYLGGNYNKKNDIFVFYTDQAHAWAEICVENYKWIPIDPSPTGPLDVGSEESDAPINISDFHEIGPDNEKIRDARFSSGFLSMLTAILLDARQDPVTFINLVLLTYPISYFLIFGFLNFNRKKNRKSSIKTAKNLPYLAVLHKAYGRKPDFLTYMEYQELLKQKGVESKLIETMISYYYKVCYENQDRDNKTEQEFIAELKQVIPTT